MKNSTTLVTSLSATLVLASVAPIAAGQTGPKTRTSFSIDNHGPSNGTRSCGLGPFLFQADILRPAAPFGSLDASTRPRSGPRARKH